MDRETQRGLVRRLLAKVQDPTVESHNGTTRLGVGRYLDSSVADRERSHIFRRHPIAVAHTSELTDSGDFRRAEVAGVPLVVVRDGERVRAFVNACRHRGARLVDEHGGCGKKAFTCPYHAWSYKLDGELLHVPNAEVFGDLDLRDFSLAAVPCQVRHGMVWVQLEGEIDVAGYLDALDADFSGFDLQNHRSEETVSHRTAANWKLIMDAFAEGYHLRSLHRKSLSRFFLESSILDPCGRHIRQLGARKSLLERGMEGDFRENTTLFYNVFPNSVLVFHPLFISWMTLFPRGVGEVDVIHRMLVPPGDREPEQRTREVRSFAHIDGQVFEKEDLAISESIQSTLASGVNTEVTLGGMEEGMRLFHATWADAMI